ncbi:098aa708-1bd2-41be-aafe-19cb530dbafd [Sclerotinia trifoliorum]|uniref:098aa708-1bd2-41be-aafe-19cb530dbafd n=1 Tax=Sclerotinia trifoliorum TaxID=28548 RepID=A0A8H2VS20_9HELO|nr:098aa708-1bd2-41be-aafe-19cb530dbafd [Sclerotinia trifoliorum]
MSEAAQINDVQTNDGAYKFLTYKIFGAVEYERYMSWEADEVGIDEPDKGCKSIGQNFVISKRFGAEVKVENRSLPGGWFVSVMDAKFKSVAAKP